MRGEDFIFLPVLRLEGGSPPHARGRQDDLRTGQPGHGITPACAGKTCSGPKAPQRQGDHPRMRGEDTPPGAVCLNDMGSPPHARGRPRLSHIGTRTYTDHPRMRGEDADTCAQIEALPGSPPHARGRPGQAVRAGSRAGITPACAGKTACLPRPSAERRDHPRMRGEDGWALTKGLSTPGSPPHARGRPQVLRPPRGRHRITPACAGKTSATVTGSLPGWDHPRMRGEDASRRGRCRGFERITPACAGKTLYTATSRGLGRDHPRMRGEDDLDEVER